MTTSQQINPATQHFLDAIAASDAPTLRSMVTEGFDMAAVEVECNQGVLEYAVQVHADFETDPMQVLPVLLELGANMNAAPDGSTALLLAVLGCNVDVAEWLILHGADVNMVYSDPDDPVKFTALDYAYMDQQVRAGYDGFTTHEDYQRLIDMLLRHGAKMANELGSSPS